MTKTELHGDVEEQPESRGMPPPNCCGELGSVVAKLDAAPYDEELTEEDLGVRS